MSVDLVMETLNDMHQIQSTTEHPHTSKPPPRHVQTTRTVKASTHGYGCCYIQTRDNTWSEVIDVRQRYQLLKYRPK